MYRKHAAQAAAGLFRPIGRWVSRGGAEIFSEPDHGDQDGGHELVSFSLWDDPAAADQNIAHAERFVREHLADLLDTTLQSATGEVFFAR